MSVLAEWQRAFKYFFFSNNVTFFNGAKKKKREISVFPMIIQTLPINQMQKLFDRFNCSVKMMQQC